MSMDFDEYDYLEKAVELSELHTASTTADCKGSKKEDEDGHKHNDRTRKSRVSDEAADRRPGNDRHNHDDRSKKTRVSDYSKDRSGRDQSEREWKKERERPSHHRIHDRERRKFNNRDRERGGKDWNVRDREQERLGSWHNGGGQDRGSRERFYGRNRDLGNFEGRVREREERHSDKEVEKEVRLTHGDKELGGSRYSREKKERKEDAASTETEVDPERDQRTVFAFQISLKADERDVYDFFSRAGKVRDVRLIMDRNLRRSKGVGYVEFYDAMSVPMAIAMTGQLLLGQPVMVKPSEAEKNLVQSTAGATGAGGAVGPYNGVARRLYVGNLHYNITDVQLKQVFEPFGAVELVQLPMDSETGQSKGYAFIQFARLEEAQCAQVSLNGTLELAGRVIKVLAVTDQMHMQEPGVVSGELDDDDGGGLSLTARSRTLLMQKLDRSGTVTSITGSNTAPVAATLGLLPGAATAVTNSVPEPSVLGSTPGMLGMSNAGLAASAAAASIGTPTECLLLQNMFDPSTETDVDFDLDIKDEVESECSKFGAVRHIYVDKISAGHVYLRFEHLSAASGAQRALHGRWFAGKMITVTFLTVQEYEKKFPDGK